MNVLLYKNNHTFSYDSSYGAYVSYENPSWVMLTEGKEYVVEWDGTLYNCTAFTNAAFAGAVILGNASALGGEATGEPFLLGVFIDDSAFAIMSFDTEETHTVGIFSVEDDESNIVFEKTISGFSDGVIHIPCKLFSIEIGEDYIVKIDEVEYNATTKIYEGTAYLGNIAMMNSSQEDTGEPFLLASELVDLEGEYVYITILYTEAVGDAHTIGIYKATAEDESDETSNEIVLKDHAGNDVVYEGVKSIRIPTTDGGFRRFIEASGEEEGVVLYNTTDPEWLDKVVFWDYDGSIVSILTVEEAKMLSELPTPPTHDGLTFQGWNFTLEEIHATTDVLDIGAIYVPTDGKTHVKIEVTSTTASNRTVPTYFSQTVSNGVTIDWGDGTVETIDGTGVVTISHVYATTGEYEVTYDVADGCEMTMGGESSSYRFIWKNNTSVKIKEIYIGERVVGIGKYAFYSSTAQNIQLLTIPDGVKTIGDYTFKSLYNLKCVLIPKTVESIGSYSFGYMCYYTGEEAVLSLPNSVLTIYGYLVECSTILRVILPNELESISNSMFYNAYAMRKVILKDKITSIGANAFEYCRNLKTLELPNNVKTISGYAFQESGIESLAIPEGVTTINDYTFRYAYSLRELILPTTLIAINQYAFNNCRSLRRIIIPENVETVGSSWLEYCTAMQSIVVKSNKITSSNRISYTSQATREVVFTQVEPTSSLNYFDLTFSGKIYVPDESVDAYKALFTSTNSKAKVRPLSEYIGEKYWE